MGSPSGSAMRRGTLFHTAAQAAEAEAVFKKVLLEIPCIIKLLNSELRPVTDGLRLSPDCPRVGIPGRNRVLEIGIVGQVTADRRMVAKLLVLHGWLASSNRVEKIRLVSR